MPLKCGVWTLVTLGCEGRPESSESGSMIVGAMGMVVLIVTATGRLRLLMLPATSCWTTV